MKQFLMPIESIHVPVEWQSTHGQSQGVQQWVFAQISRHTQETYARNASRLMVITRKLPEHCDLQDLQYFQSVIADPPATIVGVGAGKLFKTTPSSTSATTIIQSIQSLFSFLARANLITHNPAVLLRVKKPKKRKQIHLEAVEHFVHNCISIAIDTQRPEKERVACYTVMLLAATGLRATEAGQALMDDLFYINQAAWLRVMGKGSKEREVVIPAFLLKIRESFGGSERVIPVEKKSDPRLVVWRLIKQAASITGIDPNAVHPHVLRHYNATALLNNGVSLIDVRDNEGHGSISVTSSYLHADEDKRHISISAALERMLNTK